MQGEKNPKDAEEAKSNVWDCDSCLYDSFELKSFKRQLDSAIASRSLSMPREALHRPTPPPKRSSKISRSLHKLLRSVFRPKSSLDVPASVNERSDDGFYIVYQRTGGIVGPKGKESAGILPEFDSLVRRSRSDRFNGTALSIPCK